MRWCREWCSQCASRIGGLKLTSKASTLKEPNASCKCKSRLGLRLRRLSPSYRSWALRLGCAARQGCFAMTLDGELIYLAHLCCFVQLLGRVPSTSPSSTFWVFSFRHLAGATEALKPDPLADLNPPALTGRGLLRQSRLGARLRLGAFIPHRLFACFDVHFQASNLSTLSSAVPSPILVECTAN